MSPDDNSPSERDLVPPSLAVTRADHLTSFSKAVTSIVPLIGPLLGEIAGTVIPNQRQDRIVQTLEILGEKVQGLERGFLEERLRREEIVDLLEDAFIQASRALSPERKQYIAALVKNSITESEMEHVYQKRLLQVLGELNDAEILLLRSHAIDAFGERQTFLKEHAAALRGPAAVMSAPTVDIERSWIHETFSETLRRLGLIRFEFQYPNLPNDELPEFDRDTGTLRIKGVRITPLGRMLLRYLDLPAGRWT